MTSQTFKYQQKHVDQIVVRDFAFEFPPDLDPVWCPGNPARSHLFNGLSIVKPYLEPYLAKSTQAAIPGISSPELAEDMRAFSGQESRHYMCHRRLNEILKANGYPELAAVEKRLAKSYRRLSRKSLQTQLAYNAGFECMTNGFTNWMINKRQKLYYRASPVVASFLLMHAVEEAEHKTVAYDVYMAYSGKYLPRAIGVFHGSMHVLYFALVAMLTAMKKDKSLYRPSGLAGIVREVGSLIANVTPYFLRALAPRHNPRCDEDPQWMKDWIRGYAQLPEGEPMPLVDTDNPDLPVPFKGARQQGAAGADAERRRGDRRSSDNIVDVMSVFGFPDRRVGERRTHAAHAMA